MWQRQPESVSGEFTGRTSQEAVRRARAELGRDAPVRCWKTRRGGFLGFFATEAFVAGIEPPPGAIKTVNTTRPARARAERDTVRAQKAAEDEASEKESTPSIQPERLSLSQLVEGTSDEVTLGSDPVPDAVFSEVLAEAEAAVSGGDVITHPHPPVVSAVVVPSATPSIAGPERIEGLIESLALLGVPMEYRPHDAEATLDGLVRALAHLPEAPPIPNIGGSVIAVVGARRDVHGAAQQLLARLALQSSDVITAEPTDVCRQRVARRRSSNKVTLVCLEASLRARTVPGVATWLQHVKPDYVLGAVPATAKRSDIAHWGAELGSIDALAVSRLASTATPGELLGELPILLVDGTEATTIRWVVQLLGTMVEGGR